MAKKKTEVASVDTKFLASFMTAPDGVVFVTQEQAMPYSSMIEVNMALADPHNPNARAARLNEAGRAYLAEHSVQAKPVSNGAASTAFTLITGAVLPASQRGNRGGGAPTKYPFDGMEPGQSFFVPSSPTYDPVKKLQSTVSSANARYAVDTGEVIERTRTKRGPGNKKVVNDDGTSVKETVSVALMKHTRKYSIRAVKGGITYGEWTAPADGALIARTE
jgi:hypothetical protein